jgi:Zn-dependent protease with chaperone function
MVGKVSTSRFGVPGLTCYDVRNSMMSAPAMLPPRRSLALWARLSLSMVLGSYLLILLTAAACVYLPYLGLRQPGTAGLQSVVLFLFGVVMAGTMLWSLLPRRDKFLAPGPLLERTAHPHLFAELENIARLLHEPFPDEAYLIPQVNAFVSDRGGGLGLGARRVMGIGLPLIAILDQSEFRAVLAHEFAHYYGGDTRLGPWVYKTRMAMVRTIQNMASLGGMMPVAYAQIAYRFVMLLLEAYWKLFFRATQGISRRQEYRADELACHIADSEHLVNGLRKIHGANAAFPAYWMTEVVPLLNMGLQTTRRKVGQRTIIHVRAGDHARRGDYVVRIAPFHDQRNPFRDLLLVIGKFHPVIQRMARQGFEPLAQEIAILNSTHETEVGHS